MDGLICVEVRLLTLPMLHVILPETVKKQAVLLVHKETLAITFVRFHCANVSSAFFRILHSSKAIVLAGFKFSDVLRGIRSLLSETLG